jgi:hypothetical protein
LFVALASSLDFLQGTFEKIGLQRFVRHQPLQLRDLLPQLAEFSGGPWPLSIGSS